MCTISKGPGAGVKLTEKRKICVVTGSRADYGYLVTLMRLIREDPGLTLQVAVTGAHLWPEFGETCRTVEEDGFSIDAKVELPFTGTSSGDVARFVGRGVAGFAEAFERLAPDIAVLMGDRYEIFAAAQAALFLKLPLAHVAGGDVTEGAFDEAMRHGITKMAHLHFTTNADSARRVAQLGENPDHVFNVGSTGLDGLQGLSLLSREDLARDLDFSFQEKNILATFHPVTLDRESSRAPLRELLGALDVLDGVGVVFTAPNADTEGMDLMRVLEDYADKRPHVKVFKSLGNLKYFSLMSQVDAVVGNSSSGLYEAPSFKKPTVNIGDRQKGRVSATSVLHCAPEKEAILRTIRAAFELDCSDAVNPYGDGNASRRILDVLKGVDNPANLVKKKFFDFKKP